MHLHEDRERLWQYIAATAEYLGIADTGIVEKDYFVTLFLKEIAQKQEDIVFKGGTSLSKCYNIIKRFSEDIDLSLSGEAGRPSEGNRRRLKKDIVEIIDGFGFTLENAENIRSRRDFNRYIIGFPSVADSIALKQNLIVETAVFIKPFPVDTMYASSFIYGCLEANGAQEQIEQYALAPFAVKTQTLERTFIDKVFAVADYYLAGNAETHSRHIYDLYMLYPHIVFDQNFGALVADVREVRSAHKTCLSAQEGIRINELMKKIKDDSYFRTDYNRITSALLFDPVSYDEAQDVIGKIIDDKYFG